MRTTYNRIRGARHARRHRMRRGGLEVARPREGVSQHSLSGQTKPRPIESQPFQEDAGILPRVQTWKVWLR